MPKFLRVSREGTYNVRFVRMPYRFWVRWSADGPHRRTFISHEEFEQIRSSKVDTRVHANERYACLALHREANELVVIEGPPSLFKPIADHAKSQGINPSHEKDGFDYEIKTTGSGISLRYAVTPIRNTPLSVEEQAQIMLGSFDLEKYYSAPGGVEVAVMDAAQLREHIQCLIDKSEVGDEQEKVAP